MIPTNVLFVFILLVAGYISCSLFHWTHWTLKRSSGYHTFLMSAVAGFVIIAAVFVIRWFLVIFGPDFNVVDSLLASAFPQLYLSAYTVVLIELVASSLLLALSAPISMYLLVKKFLGATRSEMLIGAFVDSSGSPEFTNLIYSSLSHGLPILFTLSDRKVYIGYPLDVKAEDFNDIRILPTLSGYRKDDTLELELTTNYDKVLNSDDDVVTESFLVTVPVREIVHAHLFDLERYEKYWGE